MKTPQGKYLRFDIVDAQKYDDGEELCVIARLGVSVHMDGPSKLTTQTLIAQKIAEAVQGIWYERGEDDNPVVAIPEQ